ncbi:MAG TPA: SPFH domain-containing protein [Aggregatilineales bacterium]|nr:SPFH domain-containing protein [Aggregatilineales bacterium]
MARIIDVLSHENVMDDELVYREPQGGNGDFRMGSQVIVQESQAAVFVRQGQALDILTAGTHTLSTGNLPLLSNMIGMVTSGKNPFTCDVYFVNLKDLPQVGWGTNPPIQMDMPGRSPGFALLITHGVVDIGIRDPLLFVKQYAVGKPILRLADLRDRIQTMLLSQLAKLLSTQQITSIQQANALLNQLESGAMTMLNDQFAAIGMFIKSFNSNPFQAKDLTPEDIVKYGGDISTYERAKRLDVAQSAAENPGTAGGLTGAGLGLGLGQSLGAAMNPNEQAMQQQMMQQQMMMQQMMQQMMQNQQNSGQAKPAEPAAPVNQNPQTKEEVQALLDSLDAKLASGEISEAVYNKLSAKWEERLKQLGG